MANGYAQRIPHNPKSKRFDSGPQILRNSFEFQPNGNATHPTIMQMAKIKYKKKTILLYLLVAVRVIETHSSLTRVASFIMCGKLSDVGREL